MRLHANAGSAAVAVAREYFWANLETTGRVITRHTNRFLFSIHWRNNIRNGRNHLHYTQIVMYQRCAAAREQVTHTTTSSNDMQIIISETHTAKRYLYTYICVTDGKHVVKGKQWTNKNSSAIRKETWNSTHNPKRISFNINKPVKHFLYVFYSNRNIDGAYSRKCFFSHTSQSQIKIQKSTSTFSTKGCISCSFLLDLFLEIRDMRNALKFLK